MLQLVTDNAINCKTTWKEIEKVHQHIFWFPCVVHSLSLILKTFAKENALVRISLQSEKDHYEVSLGHGNTIAMFRANSRLDLLKVVDTRVASHYVMLKGYMTIKRP